MNFTKQRLNKLKEQLSERNLDGFYVTNLTNVRYLSGFTGSAGQLLIFPDSQHFFSDTRYDVQSKEEVKDFDIHMISGGYINTINKLKLLNSKLKIGFESLDMNVSLFNKLNEEFPKIEWFSTENIVERLAIVKDINEIKTLKKAVEITDQAFESLIPDIKIGVTEKEISAKLSYLIKLRGGDKDSFDPIVASGVNSALPHARPSDKKLESGDFVVLDFGAKYNGYHADMTRTVLVGEVTEKHREIYGIVLKSNKAGTKKAKAGITGAELDKVCRDVITKAGYGKEFCHSTGHGIGLEVHTLPRVNKLNTEPIVENCVVTIEPGIYIPGFGGVRIEDDCWIKKDGCDVLNRSMKDLIIL